MLWSWKWQFKEADIYILSQDLDGAYDRAELHQIIVVTYLYISLTHLAVDIQGAI